MRNCNTIHSKVIGVFLYRYPNCPIIYPVVPVYHCPGNNSNTTSLGTLKFYAGFKKFISETLEHCGFVEPQGCSWSSPYRTQNNLDKLNIEVSKVNPHKNNDNEVTTIFGLSKQKIINLFIKKLVTSYLQDCGILQINSSLRITQKNHLYCNSPTLYSYEIEQTKHP